MLSRIPVGLWEHSWAADAGPELHLGPGLHLRHWGSLIGARTLESDSLRFESLFCPLLAS